MKRISGYLLLVMACLHLIVGCLVNPEAIYYILRHGLWNTIDIHYVANQPVLQSVMLSASGWFMLLGFFLLFAALFCIWVEVKLKRFLPPSLSMVLLLINLLGGILLPASGFWLVAAIAAYMFIGGIKQKQAN